MSRHCTHCDAELDPGSAPRGFEGEDLCPDCEARELRSLLSECDAEERRILRRRIEDLLRKSPGDLIHVAAGLAASGRIKYDDLL